MHTKLFWNTDDHRLRAGWRVLIQMLTVSLTLTIMGLLGVYTRPGINVEAWVVITALPLTLFVTWFMAQTIDRRHFSDFGVHLRQKRWWLDYGFGWLAGILSAAGFVLLMALLDYGRIVPAARIGLSLPDLLTGIVISILIYTGVGVFEELLRVYQVRNITEGLAFTRLRLFGAVVVAVLISGAYSLVMHIPGRDFSMPYLFFILVTGSIYGLYYVWTGRAALPMAMHAAWDFTLTNIFAMGSAAGGEPAIFSVPLQSLSGIEESMFHFLGLGGKVIGLVLVVLWVYWREGRVGIRPEIATPTLIDDEMHDPALASG